ncbi:Pimeloyl-ACP methyl ester carboxylesterase [Cellulomonas marina]|uniref:Pimeloyl-ACP methyl ester carboxylesterase n=2 Tax=Cellulomonas marina TaxID=988821 RepID=A0A1I0ZCN9_9CELL|nr:Pimeloyl-ACP methyl ester carboxylesterase [Cellulomonas marina]
MPLGDLPLDPRTQAVVVAAGVGPLTALHHAPDGPPAGVVLVVPGYTGTKEDHRLLLPELARLGWDAWTYSQRGQGDSTGPDGEDGYGMDLLADDVAEVARAVLAASGTGATQVHLVGHSFGGLVARAAVVAHPELFATVTLLCSGPHGWEGRKAEEREMLLANPHVDLWRLTNPQRAHLPDDDLPPFDAFLRLRAELTHHDQLLAAIDHLADLTDRTEELAATGVPAAVVFGEHDDAWPQEWQRAMAARLGAPVVVVPGTGHCPNEDDAPSTAAVLDAFWRGTSGLAS